jgi:hypothetical protein
MRPPSISKAGRRIIIIILCAVCLPASGLYAAMWDGSSSGTVTVGIQIPLIMFFAGIEFDPDKLEKDSEGIPVTVYIFMPPEIPVTWIKVPTIRLNDTVPAMAWPWTIKDYNGDGREDLMVHFERHAVSHLLPLGWQWVTVTGDVAGHRFAGQDWMKVIDPPPG